MRTLFPVDSSQTFDLGIAQTGGSSSHVVSTVVGVIVMARPVRGKRAPPTTRDDGRAKKKGPAKGKGKLAQKSKRGDSKEDATMEVRPYNTTYMCCSTGWLCLEVQSSCVSHPPNFTCSLRSFCTALYCAVCASVLY